MATVTFSGELIRPGDAQYDDARAVWNGAIDRRPEIIVRCTSADDVAAAIRLARDRDLPLAVRGGGHSVSGLSVCDGGVVIDLSPLRAISVDPRARTARAGAGVLWGELDAATEAHGLATVGGIVTHTGIAGLTLGGGIGWLMRKHGAVVDNLLAADLVTVDGEQIRAGEDERPDLLWALRGGGGNFGVVTSFEYRLHELGTVLAGPMYFALEDAPEVLRRYRDLAAAAPDELTTIVNLRQAPPLPLIPEAFHGRPVLMVGVCYAGALERGEELLRELRGLEPLVDAITPRRVYRAPAPVRPVRPARLALPLENLRAAAVRGPRHRHALRAGRPHHLAALLHHRLPARRRGGARALRGDRVRPARRRPQRQHQRRLAPGRPRGGAARAVGR